MAVSASFEYRLSDRWTLAAAAGAIVAGRLVSPTETFDFRAGAVGSLSGSFLALEQGRFWPFIMVAGSLAVSGVQAAPTAYWAVDGRLTATLGYTFFERVTPYAVGRVFGGPVFWRGQTGTDLFHYQVGAGVVVGLPFGFDLSAEVVPLGEQRVTAGLGFSF
jgi:hypothetical protein